MYFKLLKNLCNLLTFVAVLYGIFSFFLKLGIFYNSTLSDQNMQHILLIDGLEVNLVVFCLTARPRCFQGVSLEYLHFEFCIASVWMPLLYS